MPSLFSLHMNCLPIKNLQMLCWNSGSVLKVFVEQLLDITKSDPTSQHTTYIMCQLHVDQVVCWKYICKMRLLYRFDSSDSLTKLIELYESLEQSSHLASCYLVLWFTWSHFDLILPKGHARLEIKQTLPSFQGNLISLTPPPSITPKKIKGIPIQNSFVLQKHFIIPLIVQYSHDWFQGRCSEHLVTKLIISP